MKQFISLLLLTLMLASCGVDKAYDYFNGLWNLNLPKASETIASDQVDVNKPLSASKSVDFAFLYSDDNISKIAAMEEWDRLDPSHINQLTKLLYPYYFPEDNQSLTAAKRLSAIEEKLGFPLDEDTLYYLKNDVNSALKSHVLLLFRKDQNMIRAFHLVP